MLMQNYSFIDMRWVMRYFAGAPPHLTQYRSCGVKSVAGESDREEQ